ncbi:MAG: hypothetical protein ACYDEY_02810 [Acidimicrobiales bacterium]
MDDQQETRTAEIEGVVGLLAKAEPDTINYVASVLRSANATRFWSEVTGPCLSQMDTARLLRVTDTTVMGKAGLLRVRAKDGRPVYPIFQFDGRNQRSGVEDVVKMLSREYEPLTVADWLRSPKDDLDGMTPMEALEKGKFPAVMVLARQAVHASR